MLYLIILNSILIFLNIMFFWVVIKFLLKLRAEILYEINFKNSPLIPKKNLTSEEMYVQSTGVNYIPIVPDVEK